MTGAQWAGILVLASSALALAGCATQGGVIGSTQQSAELPTAASAARAVSTPAERNALIASDEATTSQLERASEEGVAVANELKWVEREEGASAGTVAAGEYLVTYLITPADDFYDLEAAQSSSPAHHTTVEPGSAHVGVVVRDAADGRTVPGLDVQATLRSSEGHTTRNATRAVILTESRKASLPFGWHPVLNRYGDNMILPDGPFTIEVLIARPTYARHDSTNGNRYRQSVIASFANVVVNPDSLVAASRRLARGDTPVAQSLASREGDILGRQITQGMNAAEMRGVQATSGDYRVAVTVQPRHGYWKDVNGRLIYIPPDTSIGKVSHLDVTIRDAASGRLIPELSVRAVLIDSRGRDLDTYAMPFMWHPWSSHYGLDVAVPETGRYSIRIRANAPAFRRYGSSALRKFNRPLDVVLRGLSFSARR